MDLSIMLSSPLRGPTGQSGGGGGAIICMPGAQFDGVNDFMVNNSFDPLKATLISMIRFSMYLEGSAGRYYVILSDAAGCLVCTFIRMGTYSLS